MQRPPPCSLSGLGTSGLALQSTTSITTYNQVSIQIKQDTFDVVLMAAHGIEILLMHAEAAVLQLVRAGQACITRNVLGFTSGFAITPVVLHIAKS